MISKIKHLSNKLDEQYDNELNFRNHCYLRIAFDASTGDKWNLQIKRPFVQYASKNLLEKVLFLLNEHVSNKQLLLSNNNESLLYRHHHKQLDELKILKLF
jgi:hypothetical protein